MSNSIVKFKILHDDVIIPSYATDGAAGMDVCAYLEPTVLNGYNGSYRLEPNERVLISTGLCLELPNNIEAQVRSRSGLSHKHGIQVINSPGTIDPDYRGEIKISLINLSNTEYTIHHGDKIAQIVFAKFERVSLDEYYLLSDTVRGSGGFGSTGV